MWSLISMFLSRNVFGLESVQLHLYDRKVHQQEIDLYFENANNSDSLRLLAYYV